MAEYEDNSAQKDQYNGWANYPTWATFTWLSGDVANARFIEQVLAGVAGLRQGAEELQACVEDADPSPEESGLYADLLTWALLQVAWDDVARAMGPDEWRAQVEGDVPRDTETLDETEAPLRDSDPFPAGELAGVSQDVLERLMAGELQCPHCASTLTGQTFNVGGIPEVRLICPTDKCPFETP